MIRILQVVNAADRGGAETLAMNIYRNIDRTKFQFDFTNHNGSPAAYDAEIESLGGNILYLPKFKGYNFLQYVQAWKDLFKSHPEYQIVHIHNYNIAGIVAKVAREMGVKVRITHSHSTRLNMPYIKKCVFKLFHPSLMSNTTHFFTCGKNAAAFLYGIHHPYTILPNAIETDRFKFNQEARQRIRKGLGFDDDQIVYGHVGTFRTPKNHIFLIDVFTKILSLQPNAYLVMVGSGELLPEIKEKVKQLGITNQVIFAGQKTNVNEWLSAFDIFLMPSLWEGFPVSVVEAQCSGLPCVISDVVDNDADLTGSVKFISLNDSSEAWAKEIISLNRPDRISMGETIANSPYNINTTVRRLSDFYLNVLR